MPQVGDEVRVLRGRTKRTAKVIGFTPAAEGACRLDKRLDGFQYWHKDELEIVLKSACHKKATNQ